MPEKKKLFQRDLFLDFMQKCQFVVDHHLYIDFSLYYYIILCFYSGGMAGQHYCLRWNNYQSNMTSVFHQLLQTEAFVDVTLACNEASLKAHKVINYYYTFISTTRQYYMYLPKVYRVTRRKCFMFLFFLSISKIVLWL